ncbi:MAG: undecaprenyldiphospho-muramoylpentapeptide beta-N-acetylglucosaminyltransferase [Candidatus Adiutrix sp.]|jgi:UDP-N-acetylglucosamine--N-acetylmuramyl-(pentapeptide) pyrophosphoryl-undecaprenol N-acetylglucosamine transferase|nr:undecaprenyldiphospho-muramoylpentapeptide beta-N-acetylglucosaminyltransferase [Candidatus Adiutrix sp.]
MASAIPRILIAAGGTGGHLWPAVSLAQAVRRKSPEAEFLFVGAGRPVEAKILDPLGFSRKILEVGGLKGRSLGRQITALGQCFRAVGQSLKIVDEFRPNLFFGAGGYVTVPVGLAARLRGLPMTLHEQNSRPGLSNKVLGRLAKKIFLGFEDAAPAFAASKILFTGNPVRPEIAALHSQPRSFGGRATRILVTGGSQGARALNRAAAPALAVLHKSGVALTVVHQSGEADRSWVEDVYREAGMTAVVAEFFQDMASLYAETDLVIGRAGALTLAELAAAKLPSILVPLPTAADDHQTRNAIALSEAHAAVVVPEKVLAEHLRTVIAGLLIAPQQLENMSAAAGRLARLAADDEMAEACLKLIVGES